MSLNFGVIQVAHAPVRANASDSSEMVTQLLFGETLEVLFRDKQWIKIRCTHDGYEGWMDFKQAWLCSYEECTLWKKNANHRIFEACTEFRTDEGNCILYKGSLVPENLNHGFKLGNINYRPLNTVRSLKQNLSVIEYAQSYLNAPYLWGGRSITGIDCSGFTQVVYAFFGKRIPRDASQQVELGYPVEFKEAQAGDLAFFLNAAGKIIHVGIITGQDTIIHAHGKVTEDFIKPDGIYKKNDLSKSHELHCIKRI
jgi:hypothetical protein